MTLSLFWGYKVTICRLDGVQQFTASVAVAYARGIGFHSNSAIYSHSSFFTRYYSVRNFQYERIDLTGIMHLLSPTAIENTRSATHLVVGIQWGAGATATVSCAQRKSEDLKKVQADLKVSAEEFLCDFKRRHWILIDF